MAARRSKESSPLLGRRDSPGIWPKLGPGARARFHYLKSELVFKKACEPKLRVKAHDLLQGLFDSDSPDTSPL